MSLYKFSQFAHSTNPLSKPQRGTVTDNNDPQKRGRVKCTVPGIYEGSNLPWIYPKNPYGHGGNDKTATFHVPQVGSTLTIEFPYGNPYHAFYTSHWHSDNNYAIQPFSDNYPNQYGTVSPDNNQLVFDHQKHTVTYSHYAQQDNESAPNDQDDGSNPSSSSSFSLPHVEKDSSPGSGSAAQLIKLLFNISAGGDLLHNSLGSHTSSLGGSISHTAQGQVSMNSATDALSMISKLANTISSQTDNINLQALEKNIIHKATKIFLN